MFFLSLKFRTLRSCCCWYCSKLRQYSNPSSLRLIRY
jgi:hypothetical protein